MDHRRISRSRPAPPKHPRPGRDPRTWRRGTGRTWATIGLPAIAGVAAAWAVYLFGAPPWAGYLFGSPGGQPSPAPGAARDSRASSSGPPLTVSVSRSDDPAFSQCIGWLFPQGLARVPAFNFQGASDNIAAAERWALRNNGIDVGNGTYQVIVKGNSARPVSFAVAVAGVRRRPAPHGEAVVNGEGCGAGRPGTVFYRVDLDRPHPGLLRSPAVPGRAAGPAFRAGDPGTPVDVILQASTTGRRYEYFYSYELRWRQGSRSGTIWIDAPSGQPFALAPPASVTRSCSYAPRGWDCPAG